METKEKTNVPQMKDETVNMNSAELNDEELAQVSGVREKPAHQENIQLEIG